MNKLNLGDPEFSRKIQKLYAWIFPVIFIGLTLLFVISRAWISALLIIPVVAVTLPVARGTIKLKGLPRIGLCVALLIAAMYATGFYV